MRAQGEPSVEEILDSIKKVIARDNRDAASDARRAPVAESRHDDVLDLADSDQYFHEDAAPNNHGANPAADLISEPAITSMRESLAALAMMSQPSSRPQIVRSGKPRSKGWWPICSSPRCANGWSNAICPRWSNAWLPPKSPRSSKAEVSTSSFCPDRTAAWPNLIPRCSIPPFTRMFAR
jgi:hypothetical protein